MTDSDIVNAARATYPERKKQWDFEQYCKMGIHPTATDVEFRTTTERVGNKPPISEKEKMLQRLIELCDDKAKLIEFTNTLHLLYLERHNKYNPYVKPAIELKTGSQKITDTFKPKVKKGKKSVFKGFSKRSGCKYTYKDGKLELVG